MIRFYILFCFLLGCSATGLAQSQKMYDLVFDAAEIDLGEIKKGDKAEGIFRFKNTGSAPLRIEMVSACECTSLNWTRGEIAPDEFGAIEFIFDSAKKEVDEAIDVDIYFENIDPETEDVIFKIVTYTYKLIQ